MSPNCRERQDTRNPCAGALSQSFSVGDFPKFGVGHPPRRTHEATRAWKTTSNANAKSTTLKWAEVSRRHLQVASDSRCIRIPGEFCFLSLNFSNTRLKLQGEYYCDQYCSIGLIIRHWKRNQASLAKYEDGFPRRKAAAVQLSTLQLDQCPECG